MNFIKKITALIALGAMIVMSGCAKDSVSPVKTAKNVLMDDDSGGPATPPQPPPPPPPGDH